MLMLHALNEKSLVCLTERPDEIFGDLARAITGHTRNETSLVCLCLTECPCMTSGDVGMHHY
jgi:hypothetical protein